MTLHGKQGYAQHALHVSLPAAELNNSDYTCMLHSRLQVC